MNVNNVKCLSDITPFSLLDYEGYSACILWFSGCNLRCVYCYNPDVVLGKAQFTFDHSIQFLNKRKGLLDAVVFSGGECTSHKYIIDYATQIKNMGFKIKLDTNGTNPEVVANLINKNLVDYIALDYKASAQKYKDITQSTRYINWLSTFNFLINNTTPFEVRTTYHEQLFNYEEIEDMNNYLFHMGYKGKHYFQNFKNNTDTLGKLENSNSINLNKLNARLPIEIVLRA